MKCIAALVTDAKLSRSYYPTEPRKSNARITFDLLLWYFQHGEVNAYYYLYGFDRKDSTPADYFSYRQFRALRDGSNRRPATSRKFDYICILQDKFVFSCFLKSLGIPTPKPIALCTSDWMVWLDEMKVGRTANMLSNSDRQFDGFCKPLFGMNGRSAFPLNLSNGLLGSTDGSVDLQAAMADANERYLLQQRVKQHPVMATLHPESLNTLRILTFNNNGSIHVFCAAQRMGTCGRSVDNWTAGGILVGVDLDTGRLRAEGYYKPGYGGIVSQHPQTEIVFSDFVVPYFFEAVQLVSRLHSYLSGIHSIGWDVAISETGPVVVEGNDDWDGAVPMAIEHDFKSRFLEMYTNRVETTKSSRPVKGYTAAEPANGKL